MGSQSEPAGGGSAEGVGIEEEVAGVKVGSHAVDFYLLICAVTISGQVTPLGGSRRNHVIHPAKYGLNGSCQL